MESASPTAPENLENYLAEIDSCKKQIEDLTVKISVLKLEESQIKAGNVDIFKELQDKISENTNKTAAILQSAKIKEADADAKLAEIVQRLADLDNAIALHSAENQAAATSNESRKASLLAAEAELAASKADFEAKQKEFEQASNSLSIQLQDAAIETRKLADLKDQLASQEQQIQSNRNQLNNDQEFFNRQSDQIHKDISAHGKKVDTDLAEQRALVAKAESDKNANQAILDEIKQRSDRLQELIINQKILSKEIDGKNAALKSQQDKVAEMTITLQGLKDELGKENKEIV